MAKRSKEVDAYIRNAAKFAQPMLRRIRKVAHQAFPDIQESIKWSSPCFEHHGIVAQMAAFKAHVRLVFWKGGELPRAKTICTEFTRTGMAAIKLSQLDDLPADDVLARLIVDAAQWNASRAADKSCSPKKKTSPKRSRPTVPADFLKRLKAHRQAWATFDAFPPSHQREYVEWITEAKREATRKRRIETAIEWLAEGKSRNWKYR